MPQLSQAAIKELLSLIAEKRAEHAKSDQPSLGLASVQKAFESLMARGQGSNLFWVKPQEQEIVTEPVVPILSHVDSAGAETSPSCHVVIEGDNFHALQVLAQTHKDLVDVIYIDPPYNTNRGDFRYNDTWVDDANRWKHSLWLSFMQKRLELSKSLLSESGLIFISIDDIEVNNLKLLCDEVFGAENHVNTVVVKMSEASGVKMAHVEKRLPKLKEYVLVYCKNKASYSLTALKAQRDFENDDSYIKYYSSVIVNPEAEPEKWQIRSVLDVCKEQGLTEPEDVLRFKIDNANRIVYRTNNKAFSPHSGVKRVTTARGLEKISWEGKEMLFLSERLDETLGDLWLDISTINLNKEGGVEFKNGKKPLALLERILVLVNKKDAIVLDFFAGSGTTAHAVMELNQKDRGTRQCILVTNNEVDKETAQKLTKNGFKEGSPEWSNAGICQSVTWPRVSGVASKLMKEQSAPRVEHFRLTCLPMELQSREEGERLYRAAAKAEARAKAVKAQQTERAQFSAIAWLEAGAKVAFDTVAAESGRGAGFVVVERSSDLPSTLADIRLVYLLTDSPIALPGASLSTAAARVARRFPDEQKVRVKELWIDYVKNFPVEG